MAIAKVQDGVTSNGNGTPITKVLNGVTAGNALIAAVHTKASGATPSVTSVSDNVGGTWAFIVRINIGFSGTDDIELWWNQTAIGGNTTISAVLSAGGGSFSATGQSLWVGEWSGIASLQASGGSGSTSGNNATPQGPSLTPQSAGVMYIAFCAMSNVPSVSPSSPWIDITGPQGFNSNINPLAYQVATGITALQPSWTQTSSAWESVAALFVPTGSGGNPTPIQTASGGAGAFPGVMAPRIREGKDTDEVLQADTSDAVSPVINYGNTRDATDMVSSLFAIGAGINDGQGSQLQAQAQSLSTMVASLFDMQGWIDASDVAYLALLGQRAISQLALQDTSWQNLVGDPRATDRLADTFPVTGVLSEFRFRPGDGVRFFLPDINVIDLVPRQMTQVTRTFGPTGRTSSSGTPGIGGRRAAR